MSARDALVVGLGCALAAACVGTEPGTAQHQSAIYHGSRARGFEGTVRVRHWLESFNYSSCSGTLVAPRVVITARHCVEDVAASDIAVETGPQGELGQFGVAEIRTTEGGLVTDNDFALLLMEDRVDAPALPWAESFDPTAAAPVTLVGYGKTDEASLEIGIKYVGSAAIDTWTDRYFITRGDQNGCFGDSGGTGLDAEGRLVGVITHVLHGPDPDDVCEGGRTGLNRVDPHAEEIARAIADTFVCEQEEVCGDELDDDCDGRADDGCTILGAACADSVQCTSGDCRAFDGPAVCTQGCTPGAFPDECPEPLGCEALPGGGGACLAAPLPPPPEDAGTGADAGPDGGDEESTAYGCGCVAAHVAPRNGCFAALALAVCLVPLRRARRA